MSDDPTPPAGGETQQPETQSVTPLGAHPSLTAYHSTWMPAPGTWTSPHSTWMPVPTLTATVDQEGKPKPGRYKVEQHAVTEFEVLENGHVVVHRSEHTGGPPERQE